MGLAVAPGQVTWWEQADRTGCGCVVTKKCTPPPPTPIAFRCGCPSHVPACSGETESVKPGDEPAPSSDGEDARRQATPTPVDAVRPGGGASPALGTRPAREPLTPISGVFPVGEDSEAAEQRTVLEAQVLSELLALRKAYGRLSIQKFSRFEVLRRVCGGDDLLDGFLLFQRELARYQRAGRNEAAAALSLSSPADTVLDRLQLTAEALSGEDWRDQRTARRWSDAGMPVIARDLVYFAQVAGRLGTETPSITLGGSGRRLAVCIDQMTTTKLPVQAPLIQLWHDPASDNPRQVDLDLAPFTSATTEHGGRCLRRYRLDIEIPEAREEARPSLAQDTDSPDDDVAVLALSITGRDAPMRTVFYEDHSQLAPGLHTRLSNYRTITMVEVVRTGSL